MSTIAVVFPGQGSQKLGMLQDYYQNFETFRNIIDKANQYLEYDLWNIIQNDEKTLNKTEFTQPALLATSYAIYKVLKEQKTGLEITYFAGHSLGEYTALLAAESISYKDALQLVSTRGKLMQNAVTNKKCAMSAILGLSDMDVIESCQEASDIGIVQAANFNSIGQIVISGEKNAVEKANIIAKKKGAKRTQILTVSVPSHCFLMKEAANEFEIELNKINFKKPSISIVQNYNAKSDKNIDKIKTAIIKQLYNPVLWTQTINELIISKKVTKIIECGPSKILSGLIKRINNSINLYNTSNIYNLKNI